MIQVAKEGEAKSERIAICGLYSRQKFCPFFRLDGLEKNEKSATFSHFDNPAVLASETKDEIFKS